MTEVNNPNNPNNLHKQAGDSPDNPKGLQTSDQNKAEFMKIWTRHVNKGNPDNPTIPDNPIYIHSYDNPDNPIIFFK